MGNVFFRSRPTRIERGELERQVVAALTAAFPDDPLEVDVPAAGDPVISWTDGPAGGRVADVVAGIVNWEVRTVGAPAGRPGEPAILLDRSFSDAALAVAVVRYRASNVRPYDSTNPGAVARLTALLEIDGPARSGYPVADAMADLLLAAADPPGFGDAGPVTPADRLAAKLEAVGHDALWRVAWSALT